MTAYFKLLFVFVVVFASSGEAASLLTGVVKDPQGRPVPDARLTLFSRTGAEANATSDSSGAYRFTGLPVGDYILRSDVPGFATFLDENVHVDPASSRSIDVLLRLAGVREAVIVTASSTPQAPDEVSKAITVIDSAEADDRNALSLSDVVALAPGLRVQQQGGPGALTAIHIRGLSPQDTAVLIDGLRLRDASATQGDASGLIEDLLSSDTNRVEVLRGSGSSLYGTDAIGGVVNVITDEGGGRTRGNVMLEGGSLGTFRGRAQLAGGLRGDRIQYSFGGSEVDVTSGVNGDSLFRDTGMQGRIAFHLSPSMQLSARLYGGNSFSKLFGEPAVLGGPPASGIVNAIPGSTFIPAPDDPDSTRAGRFISGALVLTGQPAPALGYSVSYQILATSRRYGDGPAGEGYQPPGSTRSLYDGRIRTLNARADYRWGKYQLLSGGYELENENYANDNVDFTNPAAANAVNVTQLSHSVFAQDQVRLLDGRWQLSGAFRAQYFALDAPLFNPLAAAPYQGISFSAPPPAYTGDGSVAYFFRKSGTKLRVHVGRGYRSPSLYERFGAGFDPIYGYSVYGDPHLRPEHSLGVDGGVDQTFLRGRLKASATYFYTKLDQVIVFDTSGLVNPATDPFGRFIGYLNSQGGLSRGAELSTTVSPVRSLDVTAAYTYVNAIESAPIDDGVLRTYIIPRNQFSMVATERATSRLSLTFDTIASSNYLAPIFGDVSTLVYRFSGIHKVNLGASYRLPLTDLKAIRFFGRVENILDQTYFESGFPTPGMTGIGGLQFEF